MALAIPANRSPSSPLAGSSNSPRSTRDRFGAPSARPVAVKGADHVGAQPTSQAGHQLDCNLHHGEHWQLQRVGHKLRQPGARRRIALLTDLHSTAHFANHRRFHSPKRRSSERHGGPVHETSMAPSCRSFVCVGPQPWSGSAMPRHARRSCARQSRSRAHPTSAPALLLNNAAETYLIDATSAQVLRYDWSGR